MARGGRLLGVAAITAIAIYAASRHTAPTPDAGRPPDGTTIPAAAPAAPAATMPAEQAAFVGLVGRYVQNYRDAANDMARGGLRAARARELCRAVHAGAVRNWAGSVYALSSNNSGDGVLEVQLAPKIYLKTWNNSLSDIGDHTLIAAGSPLFTAASALHEGQQVRFSGTLLPAATDCFRETSISQEGSMTEPEFLFRFSAIEPAE